MTHGSASKVRAPIFCQFVAKMTSLVVNMCVVADVKFKENH